MSPTETETKRTSEFTSAPFTVLSAYEDRLAGRQAEKTFDCFSQQLDEGVELSHRMWKFDALASPILRKIATTDAADASIIVVSCRSGVLPGQIKWWLEDALKKSPHAVGMVALIEASEDSEKTRRYLAEIAREHDLDFFAKSGIEIEKRKNLSAERICAPAKLKLAETRQTSPYPHWGLNE